MVDINVYNGDLELVGIVDVYSSLIWTRKYYTPSSFQLDCPATDNNIAVLQKYCIIERSDTNECMYIRDVKLSSDMENGNIMTVVGDSFTSVLYNRAVITKSDTLFGLINGNCISDTNTNRNVPNLAVAGADRNIASIDNMIGLNVENSAFTDGWGLTSYINHDTGKIVIATFDGVDRSVLQTVNPQVIFSAEYDNLLSCTYQISDIGSVDTVFANLIIAGGTELVMPLPTYSIDSGNTGLSRVEIACDVEAVTFDETEIISGEGFSFELIHTYVDNTKTLKAMKEACEGQIIPHTQNFEGGISVSAGYRTAWDLGDIVTVFNADWGVEVTERITEVTEVLDNAENSVVPVFGSPSITIIDKIKKM